MSGALKYLSNVDLGGNQLLNYASQILSSAPGTPFLAQRYYDSTQNCEYFYNGTTFVPTDATKATGIPNSALATNPLDRANHTGTQTASTISDLATVVKGYTLNSFATATADMNFGGFKLTNIATGISGTDAVNLNQMNAALQSLAAGISGKAACVAVSSTNVGVLSGLSTTVDGVALNTDGMRVLLVGQTTASQNGPWVVHSGAWTRPTTDNNNELETGALWFVEQGTSKATTQWWLNSPGAGVTITPGTTSIGIVQFGGGNTYSAGVNGGLQLVGSAFSLLLPASSGLVTDGTGTHIDTSIVARKYSQTIGDGTSTSITVTHNLGTQDVVVSLRLAASPYDIQFTSVQAATTNTITLQFSTAPAANSLRVTVIG